MFKILKGGTQLGMTEALSYIKKAKNGCYILCSEPEAFGHCFFWDTLPTGRAARNGRRRDGHSGGSRRRD